MWSKNDAKEISQFLAMDVTIQVALYTVFVSAKRCDIWPLASALSALMSLVIFLPIAKRLEFKWRIETKFLPVQRDNAMHIESQLTQSQFRGRAWDIGFVSIFIVLSAVTACSFKIVLC
jgi:hypothetical protein